jgi:hypothetical protein
MDDWMCQTIYNRLNDKGLNGDLLKCGFDGTENPVCFVGIPENNVGTANSWPREDFFGDRYGFDDYSLPPNVV